MDGEVRYCTTEDGVRIAYAVTGAGPALLIVASSMVSFPLANQIPPFKSFRERLSEGYQRIDYDRRGVGMSQRGIVDVSLDDDVRDIDAVVRASGAKSVSVWASGARCVAAMLYASRFPEVVRSLALFGAHARAADAFTPNTVSAFQSLIELARTNWRLGSRALTGAVDSFDVEVAQWTEQWARAAYESTTGEYVAAYLERFLEMDVTDCLSGVTSPVIVLNRRHTRTRIAAGQQLAALLPNARFVPLEGTQDDPTYGDSDSVIAPIRAFFAETSPRKKERAPKSAKLASPRHRAEPSPASQGTAVILFTDIADSTAITERLGDAAFRDAERALDERLRAAIRDAGGIPVDGKVLGDGVMATFASAAQAIDAARRCVDISAESELALHIGLHAGDVIREADNVYGGAVNIASRICAISRPGEILVSATIRDLARTSAGVTFDDRGEHDLKGVAEPQRVFAVRQSP